MGDRTWELARNFTCCLFVPLPGSQLAFGLGYPVLWVPHYQRRVSLNQGPSSNPFQRHWGRESWPRWARRTTPAAGTWAQVSFCPAPRAPPARGAIRALSAVTVKLGLALNLHFLSLGVVVAWSKSGCSGSESWRLPTDVTWAVPVKAQPRASSLCRPGNLLPSW